MIPRPTTSTLFPYTTLFRSFRSGNQNMRWMRQHRAALLRERVTCTHCGTNFRHQESALPRELQNFVPQCVQRSEEHTSELQSHSDLVCRLLLEKKKK